jgi:hypothetical protein
VHDKNSFFGGSNDQLSAKDELLDPEVDFAFAEDSKAKL